MRKSSVLLFVLLTLASLSLTLIPQVSSQPENIKVLSYSWYVDSIGYLDVVGEVQNVGPNTIDTVILSGTIYATDGEAKADSYPTRVFVQYLVPQQKAPFYMEFPPEVSVTGDLSWLSIGIDYVDFSVDAAEATSSYQYPDLTVKDDSGGADAEGVYWVTGKVQNTGTQTATNIYVVGTFLNATGNVVAMGCTDALIPTSLSPFSSASFKVGAFDLNQTEVPSNLKISSYSLLIQVEEPILTGAAPTLPTSTPPSTTPPSDSTPSLGDDNPAVLTTEAIYVIIAVIVIIGLAVTLLMLRKTKSQEKSQTKKSRKSQRRKKPK